MLWKLRQRYLEVTQGPVPDVTPVRYGIEDERKQILPEFRARLQRLVDAAAATKELDLIQSGLHELPASVCAKCPDLKRLNLTAQHLRLAPPVFVDGMTAMHSLTLKRCELERVDDSVGLLRGLKRLDLSENCITDFSHKV